MLTQGPDWEVLVLTAVDRDDRPRRILLVAGSAAELAEQASVAQVLRDQGHKVRPTFAHGSWGGLSDGFPRVPHRLVAARTASRWRRPLLTAASVVAGEQRRTLLAARFDPWFRTEVRRADEVVTLGEAGPTLQAVAREFAPDVRLHSGPEALQGFTHAVARSRLMEALSTALDGGARAQLDEEVRCQLTRALVGATLLPADELRSEALLEQLFAVPSLTRDPAEVRQLTNLVRQALRRDEPVLTAYLVRADLDERAATQDDPAQVAAELLRAAEPLLAQDLPRAVARTCLALEVLFHRELHSDSVDAPLVGDPGAYLAPVRDTRVWALLTQPVEPVALVAAEEPADPASRRPARSRVVVLPGPYGSFSQPVTKALAVSNAVDLRVLRRGRLRPHLRSMGVSAAVVERRLAAALGQAFDGYPELVSLLADPVPDVVLIDWADKSAVLATLAAPPGVRLVLRVHGVDVLRPWVHLLDWSRIDAVVCVSPALRELLHDVVGERVRDVPAHVIGNLVELRELEALPTTPRSPRVLCMVGWAQRVKDPIWSLEVLAELRKDGTDWRLLLLGADFAEQPTASGAAYADAFRGRAMADDVRDHVEYTGFVDDLPPVLARAGFVLSTSLRESWPVGVAEAVAAGAVPVVRDWPMLASRGGARKLYGDAVVDTVQEAVERIRSLADPQDRDRAALRAREQLAALTDRVGTTAALRELVLGDVGHLADLSSTGRHQEALAVVRAAVEDPDVNAPLLRQAAISAMLAGEQSLRLQALRRWAQVDPSEQVAHLVRQQEGRLRELTAGWRPPVPAVADPPDGDPGEDAKARRPPGPRRDGEADRVLHLLKTSLPQRNSGYTMRSSYLLGEQVRAGMDVLAVTPLDFPPRERTAKGEDPPPRPAEEMVGGVRHLRLLREHVPRPEYSDDYHAAFAAALADVVRRERPTVIHAHSGHRGYDLALTALAVGRATGVPVVYEVRGFFEALWTRDLDRAERAEMYRLRRAAETSCMKEAAAVTTLSDTMCADILERDVDPDKVFVIHNGVDPDAMNPRERRADLVARHDLRDAFTFGYVSNLDHRREGQELLVEAVLRLREQGLAAKALVVGGGKRAEELRRLARRCGVEEHVLFTGQVPHDQIGDYYALLDVFVIPRIDERAARLVTPLKPYEAMAMALPVVVSDLPALLEIVGDGQRGASFPAGDADALAQVLADLAADPGRREQLARAGREWVLEHRTWRAAAARYRQVYEVAALSATRSSAATNS